MKSVNDDLVNYYRLRASEHEKVYSKPERQEDLASACLILKDLFEGKQVLEIACGTGYWTEKICSTASSVVATDINQAVLEIARLKSFPKNNVQFSVLDMYKDNHPKKFDTLFGAFIWSHIKLQDIPAFLNKMTTMVKPCGRLVFMDNNYVEGSNHPVTQKDEYGNTYQLRKLEDGSPHIILKNFPKEAELHRMIDKVAGDIEFYNLKHFWIMSFGVK